jgi:branched-chain amino acid transport system ATP-binding protein
MLTLEAVNSFYGRAHILHDVGFDVPRGSVLVLLGRNGAGKSTVMKTLIGLVTPASGRVQFDGADIAGLLPHQIACLGMGYVPEERRIFTDLTVLENLEVGRQPPRDGQEPWTPDRLFALFPNLGEMRSRLGARMSGGEQQMLAIARTLMGNPRLVLLDEPSEGLAPVIVQQMAEAIRALRREGVTVLLAEQNLRFAMGVADRAAVIEKGRIAWTGFLETLRQDAALRAEHLDL